MEEPRTLLRPESYTSKCVTFAELIGDASLTIYVVLTALCVVPSSTKESFLVTT